ncbi:MAG: Sua5/YciO/YrdC/YwlC family protein, partial [Candidatus Anstonellales archaeon]
MSDTKLDIASDNLAPFKILNLKKDNLHEIVEICSNALLQNKIIVYPTDTLYGLGANAISVKAVKKIYTIKKRSEKKLLSIMTTKERIIEICELSDDEYDIITKFLPNPFTLLIKPKKLRFLNRYIAEDRIGVRVPDNSFCNELSKH